VTSPEARAFWIAEPGRGEIRREALREPSDGEVVVRTLYSGVSRGTEALVFTGRVPPSEYRRMRAPFQEGDFPGPVKYGYASVGVVERGPVALGGRTVFVLYPHQTRYVVPADAVHPLPAPIPPRRAVLAANLETAVNALWDAAPLVGDRVVVIGAGTVGSLVAWLAGRVPGTTVQLVDTNPARADVARALGVGFALPDELTADADLVVHASGAPAGLDLAIATAGFEARIVELSWYGTERVTLSLGTAFHVRRLTLLSSQVGTIAPLKRARTDASCRLALALELLDDPALDVLVTDESAFEDLPEVMPRLAAGSGATLCHVVRYPLGASEGLGAGG
jgi:2-desacetyl-2-hydroxyethyl bacteriochlorophyllide A dehydrogenase